MQDASVDVLTQAEADTRYVNVTGDDMTGTLSVTPVLAVIGETDGIANVEFHSDVSPAQTGLRWTFGKSNEAENGGDTGSNFNIAAWTDGGVWKSNAIGIERKTGLVNLVGNPTAPLHAATKQYVDGAGMSFQSSYGSAPGYATFRDRLALLVL